MSWTPTSKARSAVTFFSFKAFDRRYIFCKTLQEQLFASHHIRYETSFCANTRMNSPIIHRLPTQNDQSRVLYSRKCPNRFRRFGVCRQQGRCCRECPVFDPVGCHRVPPGATEGAVASVRGLGEALDPPGRQGFQSPKLPGARNAVSKIQGCTRSLEVHGVPRGAWSPGACTC